MVSVVSHPLADRPSVENVLPPVAQDSFKRVFDIVVATAMLVFFGPLLLLVSFLIRLESPGAVLFKQARGGLNGRVFTIYKFRSMRCQENGANVVQASRDDDRITAVGRFIRKASIDELPQLLNVLKGDMSLVGPRPHARAHDAHYASLISTYSLRSRARPGLTGLAQIRGLRGGTGDLEAMADRVEADIAYIEGWSFGRDIKILFLTVPHLLMTDNAY